MQQTVWVKTDTRTNKAGFKLKLRPVTLSLLCALPTAGISSLADCMDCPDLKAAAEDFFQLHFTEVYKLDEFLHLDVTQLTHLLHQDKLTVRAEAQVRQHVPSPPLQSDRLRSGRSRSFASRMT